MKTALWICFMIATGVYICGAVVDPDLWWHITVGRWIIANKSIPTQEYWNMFAIGDPWRAYSWSNEILFAAVDSWFGNRGLIFLQLLIAIGLSASLFYCMGRLSGDWFFGALLGIFCTAACFNHFTLRPQALVWIFFAWLILVADDIRRRGLNKNRGLLLVLLMALWANSHLSSVLGLGIVALWVFQPSNPKLAAQAVLLCFLGTLITPYLGGEWLTFFHKTGHPFSHQAITEFQPATILQYSTSFLLIILTVVVAFWHFSPKSVEPSRLFALGVFCIGGLAVLKFLPMAVIVGGAVVAAYWRETRGSSAALGNLAEAVERLKKVYENISGVGLGFLVLVLAAINVNTNWHYPLNLDVVPVEAVDFIQKESLPHPILNAFGQGGYMMYRFSDAAGNLEHKVPIDGRTNVMPPEIWDQFIATLRGKDNWQDYFTKVNPSTVLWPNESPLNAILVSSEKWCRVKRVGEGDKGHSVYLRKDIYNARVPHLKADNCV